MSQEKVTPLEKVQLCGPPSQVWKSSRVVELDTTQPSWMS
jgi:hypothetical protein